MRRHLAYLVLLTGLTVLLAPHVVMLLDDWRQARRIASYQAAVADLPPEAITSALERAEAPALDPAVYYDPFLARVREESIATDTPNQDGVFAYLEIPRIGERLPIYLDATRANLALGVAQIKGTSLPIGGVGTHSVIAGHRGRYGTPFFRHLDDLQPGDTFTIHVYGQQLHYRVTGNEVILPTDTGKLGIIHPDRDEVTLLTCTPMRTFENRLLVHAERVPPSPDLSVHQVGASLEAVEPPSTASSATATGAASASPPGAPVDPAPGPAAEPSVPASVPPASGSYDRAWTRTLVAGGLLLGILIVARWLAPPASSGQ